MRSAGADAARHREFFLRFPGSDGDEAVARTRCAARPCPVLKRIYGDATERAAGSSRRREARGDPTGESRSGRFPFIHLQLEGAARKLLTRAATRADWVVDTRTVIKESKTTILRTGFVFFFSKFNCPSIVHALYIFRLWRRTDARLRHLWCWKQEEIRSRRDLNETHFILIRAQVTRGACVGYTCTRCGLRCPIFTPELK